MTKKVGELVINVSAGTAQLVLDLQRANGVVTDFSRRTADAGTHTVSSMRAASGAIRLLEGDITNNIRAVESFLTTTLKLGPALSAVFNVVGAVSLLGVIGEVGNKVYQFVKEMEAAPAKLTAAWRNFNGPLAQTNDELLLTSARLQADIDALDGKRKNTLQIALAEARVEADKLAESLSKDFQAFSKLLEENDVGYMRRFFGEAKTDDIKGRVDKDITSISDITQQGQLKIGSAAVKGDLTSQHAAQEELNNNLIAYMDARQREAQAALQEAKDLAKYNGQGNELLGMGPGRVAQNETARIKELQDYVDLLEGRKQEIQIRARVGDQTQAKEAKEADRSNAKADRNPFNEKVNQLQAELSGAIAKMDAAGLDEAAKLQAAAKAAALKSIEEINKALKEASKPPLKAGGQAVVYDFFTRIDQANAEGQWRDKLKQTTDQIDRETEAQRRLTVAIGQGAAAVRAAAVETAVMERIGIEKYNNPKYAPDVAKVRTSEFASYDAKQDQAGTQQVKDLQDRIGLEERLSTVQSQGAAAVKLATLNYTIELLRLKGAKQEVLDLTQRQFNVEQANDTAKKTAALDQEIDATRRLAAAQIGGAAAVRRAELDNQLAALKKQGATPAELDKAGDEARERHELDISKAVSGRVNLYAGQLDQLKEEEQFLRTNYGLYQNTNDVVRALRDIEQQRLQIMVEQNLQQRTLASGWRAFMLEMQEQSKAPGRILYEGLNGAVDGVAENLSRLMTGQKATWAQTLQQLGQSMEKDALKGLLQMGIKGLGQVFGINIPGLGGAAGSAKPTGSADNPFYVHVLESANGGSGVPGDDVISSSGMRAVTGQIPTVENLPSYLDQLRPWMNLAPGQSLGPESGDRYSGDVDHRGDKYRLPSGLINRSGDAIDGVPSLGLYEQLQQSVLKNQNWWQQLFGGAGGDLKSLFGGLGGGGDTPSVTSSIDFGGFMADGGGVSPGSAYVVGE